MGLDLGLHFHISWEKCLDLKVRFIPLLCLVHLLDFFPLSSILVFHVNPNLYDSNENTWGRCMSPDFCLGFPRSIRFRSLDWTYEGFGSKGLELESDMGPPWF